MLWAGARADAQSGLGEQRGAEGSWHGLPERDSLWTVRVVRGGVVLFSFLFLVRKAVAPDRYPVSHGTVSGPASGCSVTRGLRGLPFPREGRWAPQGAVVLLCSEAQVTCSTGIAVVIHAHQKCGQHRGSGGFDLSIANPGAHSSACDTDGVS